MNNLANLKRKNGFTARKMHTIHLGSQVEAAVTRTHGRILSANVLSY